MRPLFSRGAVFGAAFGTPDSPRSGWIRQLHRWLAILFTLTVAANFLAMTGGQPPAWITYSPLPPLFLMLLSGLYMFALPHVAKRGREP